jgi:hypothetical protein
MTQQLQNRLDQLRNELTVLQNSTQYLDVIAASHRLEGEIKALEWVLINIFLG